VFEERGESWAKIYQALPRTVEVAALAGYGPDGLRRFLQDRKGYYNLYFVSRPEPMRAIRALLATDPSLIPLSSVVYDAEALFSNRERLEAALAGKPMTDLEYENRVARELSLARGVRGIMTVSAAEAAVFNRHGFREISIVSHAVAAHRPIKTFEERFGILFVGAIHGQGGPNYDAAQWFCREILPLLRAANVPDTFFIVGYNHASGFEQYTSLGVEIVGEVDDLREWYERCKTFVAPTRFSAGIPLKVIEALANGLPVVATTLLVEQLGWAPRDPVLCADDAVDFARLVDDLSKDEPLWTRLSGASVDRIETEFSRAKMRRELASIVGLVGTLGEPGS
jgi:glycosyltransferase involved in cell wall biosynthesis